MKRVLAVALLAGIATAAQAQSIQDAVKALAKLQARTETGINYRDFTMSLGEANFEIKSVREGPDAKKYPDALKRLEVALLRYTESQLLWDLSIGSYGNIYPKEAIKIVTERYPDTGKPIEHGGATVAYGALSVSQVLPHYWREAATNIAEAKKLIAK